MPLRHSNASRLLETEYFALNRKLYTLTGREWDVLALVTEGFTTAEVAADLFVEIKSIENYKGRICTKLSLKGRNALLIFCFRYRDHLRTFYSLVQSERGNP
jgi:DNA-binding NarL/FixJ family response regulator